MRLATIWLPPWTATLKYGSTTWRAGPASRRTATTSKAALDMTQAPVSSQL
jgi:hypothetical protein